MSISKPYLLFLGDVKDELAAKTAHGVLDWRPEWCLGQISLPGCKAHTTLPEMNLAEAVQAGVKPWSSVVSMRAASCQITGSQPLSKPQQWP